MDMSMYVVALQSAQDAMERLAERLGALGLPGRAPGFSAALPSASGASGGGAGRVVRGGGRAGKVIHGGWGGSSLRSPRPSVGAPACAIPTGHLAWHFEKHPCRSAFTVPGER